MGCLNWFRKNWVIWRKNSKLIETSEGKMLKTTSNREKSDIDWANQLEAVLSTGSNADFLELLNTIEPQVLNFVLAVRRNTFGETLLHRALNKFNTECLITLINKLSDEVLSKALLLKDKSGNTPLLLAAEKAHTSSNPTDFIALIEKASIDSLSAALQIPNNHGVTPLHKAAESSNSAGCLALIAKVSDAALSDAISLKTDYGFTPLQKAALNSNPNAFSALIEKLSADTLSKVLLVRGRFGCTPLHRAAQMANTAGLIASINKVNDDAIPAIIAIMRECSLNPEDVLAALIVRSDTFSGLSLFGNGAMMSCVKKILSESAFNPNLADIHHRFFSNKFASECSDRIWRKIKSGDELLPGLRLRMQLITVLMAKPAFSLTEDEIDFFRYLKKITADHQDKIETLINHHLANRPLSSMLLSRDNNRVAAYINLLKTEPAQIPDLVLDEVPELVLKIRKNEILIKIIAPRDHYDFIEQLKDYHYRPALREKIANPKYKLVHLTGEVVAYQNHNPKNKASYTHTKKSSATLLSSTLSTPVFGQHDPNRPLVGYLFNKKDCVIKAMMRQDKGTYNHQWLTQTEEEAKNAAHLIPNYNFTDEQAFLNVINTDPDRTNEVLVKVKKEALVAVVVARKDSNSISIAKERQKEARDKLGLDLPVVFYDSNNGVLELVQEKLGNLAQKLKIH
jgi:ankyrin repeat protein